jgi:hypothetical protein
LIDLEQAEKRADYATYLRTVMSCFGQSMRERSEHLAWNPQPAFPPAMTNEG